jgi:hypothetical protein
MKSRHTLHIIGIVSFWFDFEFYPDPFAFTDILKDHKSLHFTMPYCLTLKPAPFLLYSHSKLLKIVKITFCNKNFTM